MNNIYCIKINKVSKFAIGILLVIFSSCEEFLNVDNPKTELVSEEVFENDLTAIAAISSLYTKMSSGTGGLNSVTFLGCLLADESISYSSDLTTQQIYSNNISTTNSIISNFWGASGYSYVYQANSILEGLNRSNKITQALKVQLEGEALFLRAFLHFYLVNLFGDIPYVISTDYRNNASVPRSPVSEIYQQIISDLLSAQDRLASDYSFSGFERIRPNKWAATALLARAYLYSGNWVLAEEQATLLINQSALYALIAHDDVFLKNSKETIWQLKSVMTDRNTNEGSIFILTGPPRFSALSIQFVNSIEPSDLRRQKWINSISVGGSTWFYPFKYKIRTGSSPLVEYSMVLRLSEQYLIRAEARLQQGNLMGAVQDIDIIRQRSGLPLIKETNPSIGKEDLRLVIEHERRIELFSEWGHRWLDLKRTERADELLSPIKPGWQSTDVLFPIPETEVLVNTRITQNPGY